MGALPADATVEVANVCVEVGQHAVLAVTVKYAASKGTLKRGRVFSAHVRHHLFRRQVRDAALTRQLGVRVHDHPRDHARRVAHVALRASAAILDGTTAVRRLAVLFLLAGTTSLLGAAVRGGDHGSVAARFGASRRRRRQPTCLLPKELFNVLVDHAVQVVVLTLRLGIFDAGRAAAERGCPRRRGGRGGPVTRSLAARPSET
mmetsp:Transcript_560/g.1729  ORF Transcript_560/g.1729 Transcript_560/m.1729 type:complete len:204 (-) Transcript_560:471-1082(-)